MSSITSEAISQIKNLGKIVEKVGILQSTDSNSKFPNWLLDVLEYSPFWINDPKEHEVAAENTQGYCCFNHILGETIKYGKPNPLYPFHHNPSVREARRYLDTQGHRIRSHKDIT